MIRIHVRKRLALQVAQQYQFDLKNRDSVPVADDSAPEKLEWAAIAA